MYIGWDGGTSEFEDGRAERVGTVTSGTISFGSTFEFEDSDAGDPNLAYDPDSGKTVVSFIKDIPATSTINATEQGLNLEEGDAITVQAATGSSKIQGLISYALIDRSQENG